MARGICKVMLMGDVEASIEYAKSHRHHSGARIALLKAFALLDDTTSQNPISPDEARKIEKLRDKLLNQLKAISKKQFLQSQSNNQNFATFLLLRNKLKPTNDGKDANFDIKALSNLTSFFINLGNLTHDQSQNRAFA